MLIAGLALLVVFVICICAVLGHILSQLELLQLQAAKLEREADVLFEEIDRCDHRCLLLAERYLDIVKRCNSLTKQFKDLRAPTDLHDPGDVHPFAPDAFVTFNNAA